MPLAHTQAEAERQEADKTCSIGAIVTMLPRCSSEFVSELARGMQLMFDEEGREPFRRSQPQGDVVLHIAN